MAGIATDSRRAGTYSSLDMEIESSSSACHPVDNTEGGYVEESLDLEVDMEDCDDGFRTITSRISDLRLALSDAGLRRFTLSTSHSGRRVGKGNQARLAVVNCFARLAGS